MEYTSIQKLEAQFWVEFMNKVKLQLFARILALLDMKDVIVSDMVVNNNRLPRKTLGDPT